MASKAITVGVGIPMIVVGALMALLWAPMEDYFQNQEAFQENKIVDSNGTIWHRMGDTGYFDEFKKI